jgi:hypothetical protein
MGDSTKGGDRRSFERYRLVGSTGEIDRHQTTVQFDSVRSNDYFCSAFFSAACFCAFAVHGGTMSFSRE